MHAFQILTFISSELSHSKQQIDEKQKSHLERLDEAIGAYYKSHGKNDYFNDQNKGKFLLYFEQNECDPDTLDDELGLRTHYKDCVYVKLE